MAPLSRRTKEVIATICLLILGLAVIFAVTTFQNRNKIKVEVRTAPNNAQVSIDGKKVEHTVRLLPGQYVLMVSYEGFSTYQQTIELKKDSTHLEQNVALSAQTENAKKIAASESELYSELEDLGGRKAQENNLKFQQDNPIVNNIPFKTSYYSIDYGKDSSGNLLIQITAGEPLGRQVAVEKIRSWGYEPTDYRLVFLELTNPFAKSVPGRTN